MKLTRKQLEARKRRAVKFVADVLDDPDRAQEIEDESLESYAARRKVQLLNAGRCLMAKKTATKEELQERIRELEEENESLQDQLDQVADIVAPIEEEDDDEDDEDSEDED